MANLEWVKKVVGIYSLEEMYGGCMEDCQNMVDSVKSHWIHHCLGKNNSMANQELVKEVVGIYSLEEMDGGLGRIPPNPPRFG